MADEKRKAGIRLPSVPAARRRAAKSIGELIKSGTRVALTTHVNADGDGVGSEVAMVHLMLSLGIKAVIANPTPFPERYRFLLEGIENCDKSREAVKYIRRADLLMVLDIADIGRLGHLGSTVSELDIPVACIDHHVTDGTLPDGPRLVDSEACATGELIHDLARALDWSMGPEAARGIYVAILTDTGGFRFSNTTPRTLQVASAAMNEGVQPEVIYQQVFANAPEARIRLLAEVLGTLVVESDAGLAWVTVPPGAFERHNATGEDLEGVVEYPRSIEGIHLALLFREIANGRIKVSFRSVGDVDVARLAAEWDGGGHSRAAGASIEGDLCTVQEQVLGRAREFLKE